MTTVYCPFPVGCTLEQAAAIPGPTSRTLNMRDDYPALPWTMEELVGSDWRNVYTGGRERVLRIGHDRWKRPCLVTDFHDYEPEQEVVLSLGLWWTDERYVIENEIRVDTLPPETEMEYALRQLARLAGNLEHNKMAWFREEVDAAEEYVRSFAQKHNLPAPDVKNIGRKQLLLF